MLYIYTYIYVIYIYILYVHTFPPFFIYCYFYCVRLFLENSSIFSQYFFADVFVITWTITYSKKHHSIKTSDELFWVILGLISLEFLYLLRAVKPCLKKVCKDVFCITPMPTALNFFSQ